MKSGFSLVEILVVLSLMTVALVGVMKLSQQGANSNKQTESKFNITHTHAEIISNLSNRDACFKTISFNGTNTNLNTLIQGTPRSINFIKTKNGNNFLGPIPGAHGNIRVEQFSIEQWNNIEKEAIAMITYSYKLSQTTMTRKLSFKISFEMNASNPNIMTGCTAISTSAQSKEICDSVLGIDINGLSYFQNGICESNRAACEKINRSWNSQTNTCEISFAEKLQIKKIECDTRKGLFVKGTSTSHSWVTNGLSYSECSEDDLKTGKQCYCKTEFRNNYFLGLSGTTETLPGTTVKRISMQRAKFNIISKIFPVNNLIPNRSSGLRMVRISATATVSNPNNFDAAYSTEIGCYHNQALGLNQNDAKWFPNYPGSSDFNAVYGNAVTMGYVTDFSRSGYNPKSNLEGNTVIAPKKGDITQRVVARARVTLPLPPGAKCVLMVYTDTLGAPGNWYAPHDLLVESTNVEIVQYTDDSQFTHDPEQP